MTGPNDDRDPWRALIPPLHPAAWMAVPLAALIAVVLFWIWTPFGWIGLLITVWGTTLFRMPERMAPDEADAIVSPVDGIVSEVGSAPPPAELGLEGERRCVCIVPGVWDSHVVRAPMTARLARMVIAHSRRGANRMAMRFDADAAELAMVQLAEGLGEWSRVDAFEGQQLAAGDRLGLVLPMGRVEIYLPPGVEPLVRAGSRMVAGETLLGEAAAQPGATIEADSGPRPPRPD